MSQDARKARRAGRVVLDLYRTYDPEVAKQADKMEVTCRSGCSHCCMLPASATVPEMAIVVDYLSKRADWPDRRPQLERAITRHLHEFANVDILSERERAAFFTRQLPCVFLKDHRCEIYPVRPTVCRYYFVVTPPKNCAYGAEDSEIARLDLHKVENDIAIKGAAAYGELTGGPIALAFALAAAELGVRLDVPRSLIDRAAVVRISIEGARNRDLLGRVP